MATVILTTQPASLTAIPGQDSTFSVVASADFSSATYVYQWKANTVNISGAIGSSYTIDPVIGDNTKSFTVSVSALSATATGPLSQATVLSEAAILTVNAETSPFDKFAVFPETGKQRFLRLHNLGYL